MCVCTCVCVCVQCAHCCAGMPCPSAVPNGSTAPNRLHRRRLPHTGLLQNQFQAGGCDRIHHNHCDRHEQTGRQTTGMGNMSGGNSRLIVGGIMGPEYVARVCGQSMRPEYAARVCGQSMGPEENLYSAPLNCANIAPHCPAAPLQHSLKPQTSNLKPQTTGHRARGAVRVCNWHAQYPNHPAPAQDGRKRSRCQGGVVLV